MPLWLKPTGGFGIGMQSGFMAADEIVIVTKCEKKSNGPAWNLSSFIFFNTSLFISMSKNIEKLLL